MTGLYRLLTGIALLLPSLLVAVPAVAQGALAPDTGRPQLSREELSQLLAQADSAARSPAYSLFFRDQATSQANLLRQRLVEGDFKVGDEIVLTVRDEAALSGTFTVQSGPSLLLPEIGRLPLRGILRSELNEHLTSYITRFVRMPDVQSHSLFRIMVSGAVARAGYYVVPAQSLVSDAIMGAGGFAPGADLENVQIVRGGAAIWSARDLQEAIAAGRTFDELSLSAGDHLVVPTMTAAGRLDSLRSWAITLPALVVAVTAIRQIF